ncbi:MAG: HAMP domain-containing histidine kinase [Actinobacteria bacterium]|nr:HAMP domain-containing histidine kinase [Actinomycetota bacterium]
MPQKVLSVEVREVIDRVLAEHAEEVSKRGLRVIMGKDLGRLRADPIQIYQLFGNLVGNSLRYNDRPSPELRVDYLGMRDEAHVYRLCDNGPGIPEDLLPALFEPFSKGSRGDAGIGLAIAKKVVEAYGGEIKAFNEGKACFESTLRDATPPISR